MHSSCACICIPVCLVFSSHVQPESPSKRPVCLSRLYHLAAALYQHDCVQVVCGLDHTLAVSQTGVTYAFGDNSLCQLGRVGNMGVQTPSTTPHDWIIHDEAHEPIQFTKVAAYGASNVGCGDCP